MFMLMSIRSSVFVFSSVSVFLMLHSFKSERWADSFRALGFVFFFFFLGSLFRRVRVALLPNLELKYPLHNRE